MRFFGLRTSENPAESLFAEAYVTDARIRKSAELLATGTHTTEGFDVQSELAQFADERGISPDQILEMLVRHQQTLRPIDP